MKLTAVAVEQLKPAKVRREIPDDLSVGPPPGPPAERARRAWAMRFRTPERQVQRSSRSGRYNPAGRPAGGRSRRSAAPSPCRRRGRWPPTSTANGPSATMW